MSGGTLALIIPIATLVGGAIGWLCRQYWHHRVAKREAAHDASTILKEQKTLFEDIISKTEDTESKQTLLNRLEEVNAALLGLHTQRLRHTLKEAGLPPEEALISDGISQLQPQPATQIKKIVAAVDALPKFLYENLMPLGSAYYLLQRYEDAKNIYDRIIDANPYDHDAIQFRGVTYYRLRKYEEALADFNRALELNSDDHVTLNDRGVILKNLGKYEDALSDFNHALELKPNNYVILDSRGNVYTELRRYDEALADHNRALEIKPDNPVVLNNRGIDYVRLGKYHEALTDFNRSLELQPDDAGTLYNLACLFSLWGKPDEALVYLEKAIGKDSKYRGMAKTDKDFDNIRSDPRFKRLIESD